MTSTPEAVIPLLVRGTQGRQIQVQAVLDTGFTDYLTLPLAVISQLGLPYVDTAECQLADGHVVNMESFEAAVDWHGSPREILALASEGDPLLGMSLLYGSCVTIEVLAEGTLRIERMG